MADTNYAVNHPLAVKTWAKDLYHETLKETFISRFMGTTSNSLVHVRSEVSKGPGDQITVGLRMQLSGTGVQGDATLEGQEEALSTYSDQVSIDQIRHAVRSNGRMSEQRVPFNVREECRMGLSDWYAAKLDTAFFNHITGASDVTNTLNTGNNSTVAPSTTSGNTRIIYADGGSTTEGSLSASQYFQLSYIDSAMLVAKTATPAIRPIRYQGGEYYVCFLHPQQVKDLKTDVSTSRITWFDAQKARVQGGEMDNGIFTGALGIYNNTIIHESTRIPLAPSETDVRRAVFCGAQAVTMAFGQDNSSDRMTWVEETFDYGNKLGVSAGMIWGLKKTRFNAIDFATVVISTYSAS